ncbi:MAG: hypothetical protein K2J01_02925 [Clostridiales bacterium]|nr:hypothetical protein [Clostridiales bacterium]
MKNKTKTIISAIAFAVLLGCATMFFSACGDGRKHYTLNAPEDNYVIVDAFVDYIDVQVTYRPYDDIIPLFMITPGDGKWVEANNEADRTSNPAPMFTHRFGGLTPNTEYTVSVKYKGNATNNDSAPCTKTVTTLKYTQDAPEATFSQADKTVTVEQNAAYEYSFDDGATYGTTNVFTYSENGKKTIKVRYKATNDKYASADQIINVKITDYYAGFGTKNDPYQIATFEHFEAITSADASAYFKLISDITFPDTAVAPRPNIYRAHFDGNGHKLINPIIAPNNATYNLCGVFSQVGAVQNLTVENAKVDYLEAVQFNVGIIAGIADVVKNCKVSGEITVTSSDKYWAECYVGGIIGRVRNGGNVDDNDYKIFNLHSDVKIRYNSSNNEIGTLYVGGLFGADERPMLSYRHEELELSECGANVDIELLGTYRADVGGLVGSMTGDIKNCYSTGTIVTDGAGQTMSIGGIASYVGNGSISSCYAAMNLTANGTNQNVYIGGIARSATGTDEQEIANCFFVGNIAITAGDGKIAMSNSLIVGILPAGYTVNNCYHSDNLVSPVSTDKSTAVSEELMATAEWQQNTLNLSADIWSFEDGKYPTLK